MNIKKGEKTNKNKKKTKRKGIRQTFLDLRDGGLYNDPVKLGVRERIEN